MATRRIERATCTILVVFFLICFVGGTENLQSVKKDLHNGEVGKEAEIIAGNTKEKVDNVDNTGIHEREQEIIITEKPMNKPVEILNKTKTEPASTPTQTNPIGHIAPAFPEDESHRDVTKFQNNMNLELDDTYANGFYFFLGLSTLAVVFIVFKIYRLRLSRAERKYGVQGDRSTQELTPLPVSSLNNEDMNSDDDDQTLFEINRQQLRIL